MLKQGSSRPFFFQAEDGIRYLTVTGVQTCALPISRRWWSSSSWLRRLQALPELGQGPGVENIAGLQPGASREIDRVLHERQVPRLVAVRREHEPDAVLLARRRERVGEIHALGVAVQLEQATRRRAGTTQGIEVEGVGLACSHETPPGGS